MSLIYEHFVGFQLRRFWKENSFELLNFFFPLQTVNSLARNEKRTFCNYVCTFNCVMLYCLAKINLFWIYITALSNSNYMHRLFIQSLMGCFAQFVCLLFSCFATEKCGYCDSWNSLSVVTMVECWLL